MAINKNFVVKNGLEVNTNQLFADSTTGKVGIGSTLPTVALDVQGGIAATDVVTQLLRVSGYATFPQVQVNNNINISGFSTVVNQLNVLGMTSVTNFKVTGISTFNDNSTFDKNIRIVGFSTFVGVSTFNGSISVGGIATFFNGIDVVNHTEVDNLRVSGFSTFVGIGTFSSDLYVGGDLYVSDDIVFDEFRSRNAWVTGVGTISTLYVNAGILTTAAITNGNIVTGIVTNLSGTHLNYTGISTFGNFVDINASADISGNTTTNSLAVSGFATVSGRSDFQNVVISGVTTNNNFVDINASADISGNTTTNSLAVSGFATVSGRSDFQNVTISGVTTASNFVDVNASVDVLGNTTTNSLAVSGFATVSGRSDLQNVVISGVTTASNFVDVNASADISGNLLAGSLSVTGVSTLGTVRVSSGVVTAASGVVTYYGDGTYLNLSNNSSTGIGIGTTGGVVGYGITFLSLKGAGVSTTQYNSSVGIATIFFEGGSGSASIGIGSTPGAAFPPSGIVTSGNLWYNTNLARLLIYYQDDDTAQWVDAAPFNVGIITQLSNISFANGSSASPSWYFENSTTTGVFSPTSGELTFVSTGSSILNINQTGIKVTGIVTATNFDSLSDESLKENITTVTNAIDIVNDLRGVRFEWKKDHKPSYGVIAQELEQVLPELVSNTDPKTVNYSGIIGVLIEAIKEQQKQIDDLIAEINDK